jgi:chemotaxis protein methyltransferase CheR
VSHGDDVIGELARLIEEASGNVVPPGHLRFLRELAARRAHSRGIADVPSYVSALARGALEGEWSRLLPLVTINESYFFRTPQHFHALQDVVLPRLLTARHGARRLAVWSAGCARGEEPGTIAIVLQEHEGLSGWDWRILATDVDEAALSDARRGAYSRRAVQHVPPQLLARYFSPRPDGGTLSAALHERIDYRFENLVHEVEDPPRRVFDIIFLRNVLIYFRFESQRRVVERIARTLAPDGVLFLGPAETLWQLSDAFEPEDLGDCYCYHLRSVNRAGERRGRAAAGPAPKAPVPVRRRLVTADTGPSPPTSGHAPTRPAPPPQPGPGESTPPEPTTVRTVEALLAAGRLDEATEAARALLPANPMDPALRTLEGLVHDLAGRAEEAAASYRAALFLDSSLFQTRLLLADTLRRLGWEARAEHEYRQVLSLIAADRASEVALGGVNLPDRGEARHRCRQALGRAREQAT